MLSHEIESSWTKSTCIFSLNIVYRLGFFVSSLFSIKLHVFVCLCVFSQASYLMLRKMIPQYLCMKSNWWLCCFSVMSDSLQHHELQQPGFPVLHYLLEFAQTHFHWFILAFQLPHPLSPPSPPALNLSHCKSLFQWVGSLHQVTKVLEFSISLSNKYLELISFKIDWFDLLAVQGTL